MSDREKIARFENPSVFPLLASQDKRLVIRLNESSGFNSLF